MYIPFFYRATQYLAPLKIHYSRFAKIKICYKQIFYNTQKYGWKNINKINITTG